MEKNKDADFAGAVDTNQLFEFVEKVMTQDKVWTFPFDSAQDIVNILRMQFAYLFHDSLILRTRLAGKELPSYFHTLSPGALRLALEKPELWEYKLFFRSWADAVEQRSNLFREYRERLRLDLSEPVSRVIAQEWMQTRLHELKGLVDAANTLLNDSAQKAFGLPGEPGDVEEIVWVSQMLGHVLEAAFKWAKRIRCANVEEPFNKLMPELALFADRIITELNVFPNDSLRKIEEALTSETEQTMHLSLSIELANVDSFNMALNDILSHQ